MVKVKRKLIRFKYDVIKGKVLGVNVYRGFAKLSDLAKISQADIFDQRTNPLGTQRDLSPKHAREAYTYVHEKEFAFYPEVFLCVRDSKVIAFKKYGKYHDFGQLTVYYSRIVRSKNICISRVDGNHRLHFVSGAYPGFPEIDKEVSFCLAYDLTLEQEIELFRDINNNQKRMNTSHLDNIELRLSDEDQLKKKDTPLYFAKKLGFDDDSPLKDIIFEGGKKPSYFTIPLRSLKLGIQYMLSQPSKLTELPDIEVQYIVIRNYLNAIKKWLPEAWRKPKNFIVLRGVGLWAICFIGASVIDRSLSNGKFSVKEMLSILESGKKWDWSNNGSFSGYSGRGGAVVIRDKVVREFAEEGGISIKALSEKILKHLE
jgi:DGQHR domain-containing protein